MAPHDPADSKSDPTGGTDINKEPRVLVVPQTQLEIEDTSNIRYNKLCNKPCNHDIKMCVQSIQSLPPRTLQTLRILGIIFASVLAIIAIFFIAKLAGKNEYGDNSVIIEHEIEEKLQFRINNEPFVNPNLEYNLESGNVRNAPKIIKDQGGKAHISNNYYERLPMPPRRRPQIEMYRNKMRQFRRKHPANVTEIAETLALIRKTVDSDRKLISNKELKYWQTGSDPLRILLVSTWRSGSTFLAQVLQSHPGVYEHYEPFSYLGVQQIRSGKQAFQSQQLLHRLLDCEYDELHKYNNYTKQNTRLMIGYNKRVWKACNDGPNVMTCSEPDLLSKACQLFPIQLVKTVRLRLNITQLLLNDHKLKVKVIFLVRDPRGTMSSRYSSVNWCSTSPDCSSPEKHCQDLQGDLKVAAAFEKLYPNRFLKIMYENLAEDTNKEVQNIMNFLKLDYTKGMRSFVANNTHADFNAPWTIKRNSADRVSLWKKQLPLQEIHEVQNACGSVLKSLNLEFL